MDTAREAKPKEKRMQAALDSLKNSGLSHLGDPRFVIRAMNGTRVRSLDEKTWMAKWFEVDRARLQAVTCWMLGTSAEAKDVVQETRVRVAGRRGRGRLSEWMNGISGMEVVVRACSLRAVIRSTRSFEQPGGCQSSHGQFQQFG